MICVESGQALGSTCLHNLDLEARRIIDYLQFWGKAGGVRIGEPAWHPNAYHCLDVAASAEALLIASLRKLDMLARLLGTSPDNAR